MEEKDTKIEIEFTNVTENKLQQLNNWCDSLRIALISQKEQNKDYVLFKNGEDAFLLAHGSEDGRIQLKNQLYFPQQVVQALAPLAKEQGINKIYSLCCFGGVQPTVEYDGVTLQSFHPSRKEVEVLPLMDNISFVFDVTEEDFKNWEIPNLKNYKIYIYQ